MSVSSARMTLKMAREVLGVSSLSTPAEIRRAYRAAAKRAHPDRGGDEGVFRQVTEAYQRLQEPLDVDLPPPPNAADPARRLEIPPQTALLGGIAEHRLPDGRAIRITLPAGLRCGDKVRAGGAELEVYIRAEAGVLVRGDDLWVNVRIAPATLRKGGRIAVETPLGKRVVWITRKAAERGLVRLEGQGLPARGRRPKGHLFLRLAPAAARSDSAALTLLRRFAAAWAA